MERREERRRDNRGGRGHYSFETPRRLASMQTADRDTKHDVGRSAQLGIRDSSGPVPETRTGILSTPTNWCGSMSFKRFATDPRSRTRASDGGPFVVRAALKPGWPFWNDQARRSERASRVGIPYRGRRVTKGEGVSAACRVGGSKQTLRRDLTPLYAGTKRSLGHAGQGAFVARRLARSIHCFGSVVPAFGLRKGILCC
jgi:hypothetical protein